MDTIKQEQDMLIATVLSHISSESYYGFNLGICLAIYKDMYPKKYKIIADFFRQTKEARESIEDKENE